MESVQEAKISSVSLALYRHEVRAAQTLATAADEIGVIYALEGQVRVVDADGTRILEPSRAARYRGALRIDGPATFARWSLAAKQAGGALVLQPLEAFARPCLLRCDRVDFPLGGVAYTHTHRGPGIRLLLDGELRVTTAGKTIVVRPGEAWFESGPEPVFAQASEHALTSFVRVMILPTEILGKSSIRYVNPEDQEKPKTQHYAVFLDEVIAA